MTDPGARPSWLALSGERPDERVLARSGGIGLVRSEYLIRQSGAFVTDPACVAHVRGYLDSLLARVSGDIWYRLADLEERDVALLRNGPATDGRTDNPILGARGAGRWSRDWAELAAELDMVRPFLGHPGFCLLLPYVRDDEQLAHALERLASAGVGCRVGTMIETPAAVVRARAMLEQVDFAVVGTNDLTTLTLGCQRQDAGYTAAHPAVVAQLRAMLREGALLGKPVKVAGNFGPDLVERLADVPAEDFVIHYANWGDLVAGAPAEYHERWLSVELRRHSDARLVAAGLLDDANAVVVSGMVRDVRRNGLPGVLQEEKQRC